MKKNKVEKLKLLISILSPYVKHLSECQIEDKRFKKWFKDVDDVVRTANQAWNWESSSPKPCIQLVVSNLDNLGSKKDKIFKLGKYFLKFTPKNAEHLLSFIDSLLQNLKVVFNYIDNSIVLMMEQVLEDVEERLLLLRNLLLLIPLNGPIEKQDSSVAIVVKCIQGFSLSALHMLYILCTDEDETNIIDFRDKYPVLVGAFDTMVKEEVKEICEDYRKLFIVTIADDGDANMDDQVLAVADYLIHELRLLSDYVVAPKDQIDILIDELSFLRCNLMDLLLQNPIKEMKSLVISTQVVIFRIGLFVYLSRVAKEDDTIAEYYSLRLYDLLKVVDNVKKQASDILEEFFFSRSWQSNCPSANVLEYANFLINKLDELSRAEESDPRNAALKHQIETAYEDIVSLTKLLCDDAAHLGNSQMEYLLTRYRMLLTKPNLSLIHLWLVKVQSGVMKDIMILHKEVKSLLRMTMSSDSVIPGFSSGASSHTNYEIHNRVEEAANKIVGFKDAEEEIIELLTGGSRQLKIVSIVSMPGLGKTTLADSVYKHPSINLHFHVHAWCCVSQVYEKDTLLFDILGQIVVKTIQSHEISQEDLVQKLYQSLKGRKYLIVIDDIWDIKAWNDLKGPFPDDDNGSRILVTTRHRDVALEVNSIPYALRMLSPEESCELLWIKVFGVEICPPELLAVSERIARNCNGLPLAVILIAGILKKKKEKKIVGKMFLTN